jgi:PAS domain S-box-containing protein
MNNSPAENLRDIKSKFLAGGSQTAKIIKSKDWSATSLGPINSWPQSLRTILGTCLCSQLPTLVFWSPNLIQFHNDAFASLVGPLHEQYLGEQAQNVWSANWTTNGQLIKRVFTDGESVSWKSQLQNPNEDSVNNPDFILSFSPIYDETDNVGGVYCTVLESTLSDPNNFDSASNRLLHARKKIEENERVFKNVLLQSPAIFLMLRGPEMTITFANEPLLVSWGRTSDIIGKPLLSALPEIADQPFPQLLRKVYTTGEPFFGKEQKAVIIKNGAPVDTYYNYVYQAIYGEDGSIDGVTVMASDVTESVIARQKIQESEQRLLLVTDSLPVLISYVDKHVRYQFNNKAYEKWFGHGLAEIQGKHMAEVLGEEAFQELKPNIDKVLSGTSINFIRQVHYKDAGNKFISADYIPHKDENGEVLGFYVLVNDITQKRIAEEKLIQNEEKYRSLFESMDQGFCIVEVLFDDHNKPEDYRFLEVNPVFENHTQLKNATGKKARELVPRLENRWIQIYGDVALSGLSARFIEESEAMGLWFEVYAFRIGNPDNRQVAILFTDITQRRQSEIALRESELRFRTLADNSPMFVFLVEPDEHATISYWNKTWLHYTGQSLEEAIGRAWNGIIHPEDVPAVLEIYLQAYEHRQPYFIPAARTKRFDGVYRWYSFKADPRFSPDGSFNGYVGVGFDVHEQKLTEEKLEILVTERTKQLKRSNEDLQQFAHVASHDIKEPLRKIKMFTYRLEDELARKESDHVKIYVSKILSAADRLTSMVEGVLSYSTAEQNNEKIESIDLNNVIEDIRSDLEVMIAQKSATVIADALPSIEGAKVLIHQLFYNLINNGLKFSRKDVNPIIRIFSTVENGLAIINVSDNGIGFETNYEEKIFEPFLRLNSKDEYEGTGLGLSLCKKIVLRHHGSIAATGNLGQGATFTISLPLKQN